MRLIAAMLFALPVLAAPAMAQGEQPDVWNAHTETGLAFGLSDTDERAARIDRESDETLGPRGEERVIPGAGASAAPGPLVAARGG